MRYVIFVNQLKTSVSLTIFWRSRLCDQRMHNGRYYMDVKYHEYVPYIVDLVTLSASVV